MDSEKHLSHLSSHGQHVWKKETVVNKSKLLSDLKKPALNKTKELIDMVN